MSVQALQDFGFRNGHREVPARDAGDYSDDLAGQSPSVGMVARTVLWLLIGAAGFITAVWALQFVSVWTAQYGWLPVMLPVFVVIMIVSAVMMTNALTLLRLARNKD